MKGFDRARARALVRLPVVRRLLGLAVSVGCVAFLFKGVDSAELLVRLRAIEPARLLPALIAMGVTLVFKAYRWKFQMTPVRAVSFWRSFRASTIGYMANNALPLRGGDLLRAHLLGVDERLTMTTVLATVALERFLDGIVLFLFCGGLLLASPVPDWLRDGVVGLAAVAMASGVGVAALRFESDWLARGWARIARRLPGGVAALFDRGLRHVVLGLETAHGLRRWSALLALAVVEWLLWGVTTGFSLHAIGLYPAPAVVVGTVIATNLAMVLPAAPANLGVFEYAVMATLEFYHVDHNTALGAAVVVHAVFVVPGALLGLGLLLARGLGPGRASVA